MPLVVLLVAYLLGSIPTGVVIARVVGVDPRHAGSGNIGATNVARTAGRWPGVLTLLGDALKGALSVWIAQAVATTPWLPAAAALAAIGGHLFSCFLRFRGGKGVATTLGTFLVLTPLAATICVVVFATTARAFRYVSLASMVAVTALPLMTLACRADIDIDLAALITAGAIVLRHRDNIGRLQDGTEPQFGSFGSRPHA